MEERTNERKDMSKESEVLLLIQRSALKNALYGVTCPNAQADLERRLDDTQRQLAK